MADSTPLSALRVVTLEEPRDSTKLRLPFNPAPEPAPEPAQLQPQRALRCGDTVGWVQGLANTPVKMRGCDLFVREVSANKDTITYSPNKTGKADWRTTSAERLVLVKAARGRSPHKIAIQDVTDPVLMAKILRHDLMVNDFFPTPECCHEFIYAVTGIKSSELMDPFPELNDHGVDWDGMIGDWGAPHTTADGRDIVGAFANGPFSKTLASDGCPGYLKKAVEEVEKGIECILIMDAERYIPWSKTFQPILLEYFERVQFRVLLSGPGAVAGAAHKWLPWRNTLDKTLRGPRFGTMILWIVPGKGEISIPANAAGLAVIARTVAASPQKKKTPVKESPPQKEYDGLADDWDATRPHINPPFSDPSLSTQFAALAVERPTATAPLAVMKVKMSDPVFDFDDPDLCREVTFHSDESGDEVD